MEEEERAAVETAMTEATTPLEIFIFFGSDDAGSRPPPTLELRYALFEAFSYIKIFQLNQNYQNILSFFDGRKFLILYVVLLN